MSQRIRKNLGLSQILASSVFLFNPEISVVDPLPDVFGYLLLVTGLTCLAELNESLAQARKLFLFLTWISGAQFASVLLLFGMSSVSERTVDFLLFPFVFGVLSLILALPAFKNLFDGFLYLGSRLDGTAVFRRPERKEGSIPKPRMFSATDSLRFFTYVFLILKPVMAVLPEFSALSAGGTSLVNWFRFVSVFRVMSILVMLPVGIVWLCRSVSYWRSVRDDKPFLERLAEKYRTEILPKESVFVQKTLFRGFLLVGAAAIFSVDFYANAYNVIPDFLCGVMLMLTFVVLRKYVWNWKLGLTGSAVYTVLSAAEWISYTMFVRSSRYNDIYFDIRMMDPQAVDGHYFTSAFYGVTEALFVILFLILTAGMLRIVRNYTCFPVNPSLHNTKERLKLEQKPLRIRLYVTAVLAVLATAAGVSLRFLIPFSSVRYITPNEFFTAISMIASILFVSLVCSTLVSIRVQVKNKYILD